MTETNEVGNANELPSSMEYARLKRAAKARKEINRQRRSRRGDIPSTPIDVLIARDRFGVEAQWSRDSKHRNTLASQVKIAVDMLDPDLTDLQYRVALLIVTSYVPVFGDIQRIANLQTAEKLMYTTLSPKEKGCEDDILIGMKAAHAALDEARDSLMRKAS